MRASLSPILWICWKEHSEYISAKSPNTLHDAPSFVFHRSLVSLIGDGCSASHVDDGSDRAVKLFLFERGSKAVGAGITMQVEQSRLVYNSIPIKKTSVCGTVSSARREQTSFSIVGVTLNVAPFLSAAVIGRIRLAMLGRNLW